jgi:DNA-binding LacI/PurR family transcriptional regulator
MKRKIAAFANGWSDEYLMVALKGIQRCAKEHDLDVYMYVNYASSDGNVEVTQGEINILNLPILENYDGIFLLGNTLNNAGELDILREKIKKTQVPAVCMEYELEDMDCICTDN